MTPNGLVFYRGPSLLTGDPIVGVITGLARPSLNPKTGPMAQAWILRADVPPNLATRQNVDDAICGDCKLRGRDGLGRACYVAPWLGPNQVFKALDGYIAATWEDVRGFLEGLHVRLGAYGDPSAIPFEFWRVVLERAAGWTGYTHAWRTCDPRLGAILMASVDSAAERAEALTLGWRTFRVRLTADRIDDALEVMCPASDEAGHRLTCQQCELCRGQANPTRSVAILAHGRRASFFPSALEVIA